MTRRARQIALLAATVVIGLALGLGASVGAARPNCGSLPLKGATVVKAKRRARRAGCTLRLRGAKVTSVGVQTIARTHTQSTTITAWVNPLCSSTGAPGPGIQEPASKPGATELVSGLFLAGGPARKVSAPDCSRIAGTPMAGTVTVRNAAGSVVASQTVQEGHLATFPLPAGTYTVAGTFADARSNEKPIESLPRSVAIPSGDTVRADVVVPIP